MSLLTSELGFKEVDASGRFKKLVGTYRNHKVILDEIDIGSIHESNTNLKPQYSVTFNNSQKIFLYIKKQFSINTRGPSLSKQYIHEFQLEDPLLKGLVLRGNNESAINAVLDETFLSQLNSLSKTFYELEIGFTNYIQRINEQTDKLEYAYDVEPNVLRYLDTEFFSTGNKVEQIRFMEIDMLIDLTEKVEAYTPQE